MGNNVKYLSYEGLQYLVNKIKESTLKALSESISYSDLFDLVENGELIPGKKYRINDYYTIIDRDKAYYINDDDGSNSFYCDSIGMDDEIGFDIVVTALSNNKLSEEAFAIDRDNDYFSTSNLSAWKIWYTIYNDILKYSWANEYEGKGVIYRMIDEYGNDCPYDFKSIKYTYSLEDSDVYIFTFTWIDDGDGSIKDSSICGNDGTLTYFSEIIGVTNNIIKPFYQQYDNYGDHCGNIQFLNNIVFISDENYDEFEGCTSNTFGYNCYLNTFGCDCHGNTFGDECFNNNFGNKCDDNIFDNGCYSNNFGDSCYRNKFSNACNYNMFGDMCDSNNFGNKCSRNIFGACCVHNSFDNICFDNNFGNNCCNNNFGNACNSNIFGIWCNYNSFGNGCGDNNFGNNCSGNSFSNNCYNNSFGSSCLYNILCNNCSHNSLRIANSNTAASRAYCYYIHFDDGCNYNIIWNDTTANMSKKLQNIHVKHGVSGNASDSSYNMINVQSLNNKYCTTIAQTSSNELLIYCEEDYMSNDEIDTIIENIFTNN